MGTRFLGPTLGVLNRLLGTSFASPPGSTGAGALVRATSPTLVTPVLGAATATSINFGGTTLDHYDEGTWTPTLDFVTVGDLAVTYSSQIGTYARIGNWVFQVMRLATSAFTHTTASGNLQFKGSPFTAAVSNTPFIGTLRWQGVTKANYTQINAQMNGGSSIVNAGACGSGQSLGTVAAADMPTGGSLFFGSEHFYAV